MRTFSTGEIAGRNQRYKPRESAVRIARAKMATTTRFPTGGSGSSGCGVGPGAGGTTGWTPSMGESVLLNSCSRAKASSASGSSFGWRCLIQASSSPAYAYTVDFFLCSWRWTGRPSVLSQRCTVRTSRPRYDAISFQETSFFSGRGDPLGPGEAPLGGMSGGAIIAIQCADYTSGNAQEL